MRTPFSSVAIAALTIAAIGMAHAPIASAQLAYSGGRTPSKVAGCPTIEWHILPIPEGVTSNINGVAFYTDMSGVSSIRGTKGADGKIVATLSSVSGNGPSGTVSGSRDNNVSHIVLTGAGCANTSFDLQRFAPAPSGGG